MHIAVALTILLQDANTEEVWTTLNADDAKAHALAADGKHEEAARAFRRILEGPRPPDRISKKTSFRWFENSVRLRLSDEFERTEDLKGAIEYSIQARDDVAGLACGPALLEQAGISDKTITDRIERLESRVGRKPRAADLRAAEKFLERSDLYNR